MVIYKFRNLNTGQAMPIPPGEFIVGRADEAYIHLEDGSVSRRHAKITNTDEGLFIEDLGSSNGTASHGNFIRGRLQLKFGDQVHVGAIPFRVDPEVPGEVMDAPAGLRLVSRPYMSRETERLTVTGETLRRVEAMAADKLVAPEVSTATDMDAEDLNAITLREPEAASPSRLPQVRPGLTPLPKEGAGLSVISVGTTSTFNPPRPQQDPLPSRNATPTTTAPSATTTTSRQEKPPATESEPEPENAPTESKRGWYLLFFFAGLGVGLLLGLYFAKVFLEMGGKAAMLP